MYCHPSQGGCGNHDGYGCCQDIQGLSDPACLAAVQEAEEEDTHAERVANMKGLPKLFNSMSTKVSGCLGRAGSHSYGATRGRDGKLSRVMGE